MFLINLILCFIMLIIAKDLSYSAIQLLTMLIFADIFLLLVLALFITGTNTTEYILTDFSNYYYISANCLTIVCLCLNISIAVPKMRPAWKELMNVHKGIQQAILFFYAMSFIVSFFIMLYIVIIYISINLGITKPDKQEDPAVGDTSKQAIR